MSNALSSLTFFGRNLGKVKNGQYDRIAATAAQGLGVVDKVSKTGGRIGTATQEAITKIDALTQSSAKVSAGKVCSIAGKLVNPLLVAAAGIRVLESDDKEATLYKEAGGMGAMFAAEGLVKSEACQKLIKTGSEALTEKITKGLTKLNIKAPGKLGVILKTVIAAAALVGASITAYDAGAKAGTYVVNKKREISQIYASDKNNENANLSIKS